MKLKQFINAVNNLVVEWQSEDEQAGATKEHALQIIYDEIREQAVHDLAEAIRQRDEALRQLHKHHLKRGTK
jgi:hypothetical protein